MPDADQSSAGQALPAASGGPFAEYVTDATQRTILFLDVLHQRSEDCYDYKGIKAPQL